MHNSLVTQGVLVWIAFEVKHQYLYHVSVSSRCSQVNGL